MSDDGEPRVESGIYHEPPERLTRLAGAMADALQGHPEYGDDIRAAFMVRDQDGGSGAALVGYPEGQETGLDALSDVVMHIKALFQTAGIEFELSTVGREDPDEFLARQDGTEEPRQKVVLTVVADEPDARMKELLTAVRTAIEGTSAGMADTRIILILDTGPAMAAVLHHGYESHHDMAHGLFNAFQRVISAEGGHVAVIPVMDTPN
jgi:hypothetical protein